MGRGVTRGRLVLRVVTRWWRVIGIVTRGRLVLKAVTRELLVVVVLGVVFTFGGVSRRAVGSKMINNLIGLLAL